MIFSAEEDQFTTGFLPSTLLGWDSHSLLVVGNAAISSAKAQCSLDLNIFWFNWIYNFQSEKEFNIAGNSGSGAQQ